MLAVSSIGNGKVVGCASIAAILGNQKIRQPNQQELTELNNRRAKARQALVVAFDTVDGAFERRLSEDAVKTCGS